MISEFLEQANLENLEDYEQCEQLITDIPTRNINLRIQLESMIREFPTIESARYFLTHLEDFKQIALSPVQKPSPASNLSGSRLGTP